MVSRITLKDEVYIKNCISDILGIPVSKVFNMEVSCSERTCLFEVAHQKNKTIICKAIKYLSPQSFEQCFVKGEMLLAEDTIQHTDSFIKIVVVDGQKWFKYHSEEGAYFGIFFMEKYQAFASNDEGQIIYHDLLAKWFLNYPREVVVAFILKSILLSLLQCYRSFGENFVHSDLKCVNLFLRNTDDNMFQNGIVLSDFGASRRQVCGATIGRNFCFTPEYYDKKSYESICEKKALSFAADLYSLGVIGYKLLWATGKNTKRFFYADSECDTSLQKKRQKWVNGGRISLPQNTHKVLCDIVQDLTMYDPLKRKLILGSASETVQGILHKLQIIISLYEEGKSNSEYTLSLADVITDLLQQKKYREAQKMFRRTKPKTEQEIRLFALSLIATGKTRKAEQTIKAIKKPLDGETYYIRALIEAAKGHVYGYKKMIDRSANSPFSNPDFQKFIKYKEQECKSNKESVCDPEIFDVHFLY